MDAVWRMALVTLLAGTLAGCEKPRPPDWMQITQGDPCATPTPSPAVAEAPAACEGGVFYLDRANLSVKSGTPYVILQTRYPDGRTGSIRAEANCPRQKLEPTALKEALFGKDGAPLQNRVTTMSDADEKAVLKYACAQR
jgi:hypothetical protein